MFKLTRLLKYALSFKDKAQPQPQSPARVKGLEIDFIYVANYLLNHAHVMQAHINTLDTEAQ